MIPCFHSSLNDDHLSQLLISCMVHQSSSSPEGAEKLAQLPVPAGGGSRADL